MSSKEFKNLKTDNNILYYIYHLWQKPIVVTHRHGLIYWIRNERNPCSSETIHNSNNFIEQKRNVSDLDEERSSSICVCTQDIMALQLYITRTVDVYRWYSSVKIC